MLLAIDVGNTNTVFAVFEENKVLRQWRIATDSKKTGDEYALDIRNLMSFCGLNIADIQDVIISSVVPKTIFPLKIFSKDYLSVKPIIVGEHYDKIGVKIELEKPSEIGSDRLVNAVAAYEKFEGDIIIVDFGTSTTFDVIGDKGQYLGGVIAPGINLSISALKSATAQLPEIDVTNPKAVIGKSTIGAMQSGVYWGYVGLIEGLIARIKGEYGEDMSVIFTGGLAGIFYKEIPSIKCVEPDLTINGLKLIFDKINKVKK